MSGTMLMDHVVPSGPALQAWSARLSDELEQSALPWWQRSIARPNGVVAAFDDTPVSDLPRSAVSDTRLLWTLSSALHRVGHDAVRAHAARQAWDWIRGPLSDPDFGGIYSSLDCAGRPSEGVKYTGAQALAIYALTACHAWQIVERNLSPHVSTPPLILALKLFELLDEHALDRHEGGYYEGRTRDWRPLPGCGAPARGALKSTTTLLHVLEAYTELLRHYPKLRIAARLRELVEIFLRRLWSPEQRRFGLLFERGWRDLVPQVNWGRDIEATWLLVRACEVLAEPALIQRARSLAVEVADVVLDRDEGHAVGTYASGPFGGGAGASHGWRHRAEAVVGFWDAWQIGGESRHARAAWRAWQYIELHHAEHADGEPSADDGEDRAFVNDEAFVASASECHFHHARACLEMRERLARATNVT